MSPLSKPFYFARIFLQLGTVFVLVSCAKGSVDEPPSRDSCKIRDCGPATGNPGDQDSDIEDFGWVEEDSDPWIVRDTKPFLDSEASDVADGSDAPDDVTGLDANTLDSSIADSTTDSTTDSLADTKVDALTDAKADVLSDAKTDALVCNIPSGSFCSPLQQCGCSSSTQNCDVTNYAGTASCVPSGSSYRHESCKNVIGDCAKGYSCFEGLCMKFCDSDTECKVSDPGDVRVCFQQQYYDSVSKTWKNIPNLKTCITQCDPRSLTIDTLCGKNNGCEFALANGTTTCRAAPVAGGDAGVDAGDAKPDASPPGTHGAACSYDTDCARGYGCDFSKGKCYRFCRVFQTGDCPSGQSCNELTYQPYYKGQLYGVCY